ncbi:unnamed protein product [Pipistrellus nathusii]|uniref:Uncharacterized protein n=1 Tax=Pipistrellus nathusii TaxID=59473 RepID=A0ABN9ZY15_PIPNA
MSPRSADVTPTASAAREPGANQGALPLPRPGPGPASLPVVQQPFSQSPADPARRRSAVPPGYQRVSAPSSALRARPRGAPRRHSRSSPQCPRRGDLRPEPEPLSSSLAP